VMVVIMVGLMLLTISLTKMMASEANMAAGFDDADPQMRNVQKSLASMREVFGSPRDGKIED